MGYADNIFINCPFDDQYKPLFDAIVFTVFDAGFVGRCTLEIRDSAQNRLEKIMDLILNSRYGIHDISRTELGKNKLPRFNMPFELGIFIGCKKYGSQRTHRSKACLILDRDPYRYQKFISDIAGQDIFSHGKKPKKAILEVRNWLKTVSRRKNIPGGEEIWKRYKRFQKELPDICAEIPIEVHELTFIDYTDFVSQWLKANS